MGVSLLVDGQIGCANHTAKPLIIVPTSERCPGAGSQIPAKIPARYRGIEQYIPGSMSVFAAAPPHPKSSQPGTIKVQSAQASQVVL